MANGLSTRSAAVLLAGVVLAWGTNWPVTKLIVQDVPPLWATAIRCMIAVRHARADVVDSRGFHRAAPG